MGLSVSLSNALTGMATSQSSLNVLSRNVANAGTPGYHRQSLSIIDTMGVNSVFARTGGVARAFDSSLQAYYNSATSDAGYTGTMKSMLDQLQTYFGKPGSDGSLDTMFGQFENALQALGTSPDDYATRATVVSKAQSLVMTLNSLSSNVQSLRQATETQMQSSVNTLNQSLQSLVQINKHLADKLFNTDPNKSGVGAIKLVTSSGLTLDLVQQNVLQSGNLKALVDLRDKTFVTAQSQLDEVAAAIAQSLSTNTKTGTAASSGTQNGYSLDISAIQDGNDFTLAFTKGGVNQAIRMVDVSDTSKLPLDYVDANGNRVIGADFSAGTASVANALQSALGTGFSVSSSGSTITVLDDGAANTTDVGSLTGHSTATALQDGSFGLNVFVDNNGANFTDTLTGKTQKLGFASRITVNQQLLADNKYLVQYQIGGSMGDDDRANYLLDQLTNMRFATPQTNLSDIGAFRLGGTVTDLISQTMDYTGNVAADAQSNDETQQNAMDALNQRLDSEYGVNVDEEMARLLELQNAYSANARIISAVQDLMNKLLQL